MAISTKSRAYSDPSYGAYKVFSFPRVTAGTRATALVDRFVPTAATATNSLAGGAFFLFDRASVRLAFWRPIRHYPLPPNGDHMRGYVHAGATLEVLSPRALGVGYNITT